MDRGSSGFNSYFPASTAVYGRPSFALSAVSQDEMEAHVSTLRSTSSQQEVMTIYDRITRLPPVISAHRRLHLPCIVFPVKKLRCHQGNGYYAKTSVLGEVCFHTMDAISLDEPRKLYFVHPWIHDLLDRPETLDGLAWEDDSETDVDFDSDSDFNTAVDVDSSVISDLGATPSIISVESDTDIVQSRPSCSPSSPSASSTTSRSMRLDDHTRALRLIAHLERPFNALLLQQMSDRKFRRIASENEIIVQPRRITCARDVQTAVLEVL